MAFYYSEPSRTFNKYLLIPGMSRDTLLSMLPVILAGIISHAWKNRLLCGRTGT